MGWFRKRMHVGRMHNKSPLYTVSSAAVVFGYAYGDPIAQCRSVLSSRASDLFLTFDTFLLVLYRWQTTEREVCNVSSTSYQQLRVSFAFTPRDRQRFSFNKSSGGTATCQWKRSRRYPQPDTRRVQMLASLSLYGVFSYFPQQNPY